MNHYFRIKQLKFKNFRSFKKEVVVDFPKSGLFCINGKNANTGGSSGSGKSNFHLPISYALGYCPLYDYEVQNDTTDEKVQVELTLESPVGDIVVKRGEETSVDVNGVVTKGSVKAVNAEIRKLLQIPLDFIDILTYRKQRSFGRFLSMADREKKEFLSKLLGLDEFEDLIKKSMETANQSFKESESLKSLIDELSAQLVEPVYPTLKNLDTDKIDSLLRERELVKFRISERSKKIVEISTAYRQKNTLPVDDNLVIIGELKIKAADLTSQIILEEERIEEQIKSFNKDLNDIKDRIKEYEPDANKIDKLGLEKEIKEKKLQGLLDETCPTCSQKWVTNPNKIEFARRDLQIIENSILKSLVARENINNLLRTQEYLQNCLKDVNYTVLEKLKEDSIEIDKQIVKLQNDSKIKLIEQNNNLKKLQDEEALPYIKELNADSDLLKKLEFDLQLAKVELNQNTQLNYIALANYNSSLERYNKLKNTLAEKQEKYAKCVSTYSAEYDFNKLLKIYLGKIFEEVLVEIAHEVNEMLRQIPNVASITLEFSTETLTSKDTIKQEIKPIIYKSGKEITLQSGLSGGQSTSVELAVDLAIGNIISKRTGIQPLWLILDEAFEGHGVPEKEGCLQLLKIASSDKLIFVIDHASEIKEYFDKFILIESFNDVSTFNGLVDNFET